MDTAALNLLWSDQLMDGLAAAGVRRIVLSPGSRSTPLVLAVNRHPKLRHWQHPDERSAAFFALGLAIHQRQPVALIATSGSAPAHWLAATIEANRSHVPLILLSADRPPGLQACGSNQTIDQVHLFGTQVRGFYQAGTPTDDPQALAHIRRLGIQATHQALWPAPGPVHINLAFQEPLTPHRIAQRTLPGPSVPTSHSPVQPDPRQLQRLARVMISGRGLIVCGPMPQDAKFPSAVTRLAGQLNCPLLADPLSGLRFGSHDHSRLISRYDSFLGNDHFRHGARPDWVLRFGAAPVSKHLLEYLKWPDIHLVLCAPWGDWPDPLHQTGEMVRAAPALLCNALSDACTASETQTWLQGFTQAESAIADITAPCESATPREQVVIEELIDTLPDDSLLFSGNSLPIRQLDSWSGQAAKRLRIIANRGASGIDGNVSTLLGLAAASEQPVVGLLGDLTFFHDMNGLLFARELDAVIIVFNNDGGGIFGLLPQAELETFEQHWLMPTHLDFTHTARLYALEHYRIERQDQFRPALRKALSTGGVTLIEIMLDRKLSLFAQSRYRQMADLKLSS
ncbi:MAG: 2-succinyl-5-enolpyruvyl-6-hydroxy-3-cyclohexene-1-carboxylic-acid synthase [Gammaproteobacteria bacterium]|nr:2-succinyl-5-enolpyruvyl-6-hydroxy-3-cyclohexene-1-carboxylic-acid synthase [Gammaproteobacteria bacterium]